MPAAGSSRSAGAASSGAARRNVASAATRQPKSAGSSARAVRASRASQGATQDGAGAAPRARTRPATRRATSSSSSGSVSSKAAKAKPAPKPKRVRSVVSQDLPDDSDGHEDMVGILDYPPADAQGTDAAADPADGMHNMAAPTRPAPPRRRNLDPSQLYRGRTRMALLRDLAMGEWSDASIAASVGVPTEIITDFRESYPDEIQEVRAALAGQLAIESAGLWISKKQNRLAELQEDFEDIDQVIDLMRKNTEEQLKATMDGSDSLQKGDTFDTNLLLGSRRHQNLLRSKIAILKAVADELTPTKGQPDARPEGDNTVRYVIESDTEDGDEIIGALT